LIPRPVFSIIVRFLLCSALSTTLALAQKDRVPHNQSKPPGPALSPADAIAKMEVPEGFKVELVASEPDIVNPVAMTFDERGRAWITESLEYPRMSSGPGHDRIKILEDTDNDGTMDKFTVFAKDLNIPSGIAVGYGGVWVANSPDILFLQDTNGDGKADKREVVVTGFGRDDTHELPNSLTWGPDGWLYGLNGVFNRSVVTCPVTNQTFHFTCALFRINPRTHQFELFAEGTSNPWGVAWNSVGDAFLSACVIDHLWHLTETGYYHRQGGPYPPFTWKIESIVDHKHQKAAYCGIHYFDSDAYPPEFRDRLYMGNIHGNCINSDILETRDTTYHGSPGPDLVTANDAWFMPVVQKTGPDGCLWILDWYDRYHCYQDARRDPDGIDRLKGRLYRVHYGDTPRAGSFDLGKESDDQLIGRLRSPNIFFRDIAQRLLSERATPASRISLQQLVLNDTESQKSRMHALWALIGGGDLPVGFLNSLLRNNDSELRAWAVRAAGQQRESDTGVNATIYALRNDSAARVRLQSAIASVKLGGVPTIPTLVDVLSQAGDDSVVPRIIWQNLHPLLEAHSSEFLAAMRKHSPYPASVLQFLPRVTDRILAVRKPDAATIAELVSVLLTPGTDAESADRCLQLLTQRIRSNELRDASLKSVMQPLRTALTATANQDATDPLTVSALELAASAGLPDARDNAVSQLGELRDFSTRLRLVHALITANDARALDSLKLLLKASRSPETTRLVIQAISRIDSSAASDTILKSLSSIPTEVQAVAIEALTDRTSAAVSLMNAVADKSVAPNLINANQARKMLNMQNANLSEMVRKHWGTVRSERDPARARLISQMRNTLRKSHGDPMVGREVFKKVCGQCHKIYGQGAVVGPDITRNGRASFEQLLSNVFDPSLVVGAAYQALTVVTADGRVVTGLPIEDSPQRVVLRVQGDKQEIIARDDIEEVVQSQLSLMPEGLEKQLKPTEMADLFAYLVLDRPPEDTDATYLPGAKLTAAESTDPARFPELIQQLLPGFTTKRCGEDGIAVIPDFHGQPAIRTHPISKTSACRLNGTVTVPKTTSPILAVSVAPHDKGDWELVVEINGTAVHNSTVKRHGGNVWQTIEIDLADYAGQSINVGLQNKANDWRNEFGYWNAVEVLPE
jgi:putative membrane-bound dehydrogenase-like protein